jgi:hypothetical protein
MADSKWNGLLVGLASGKLRGSPIRKAVGTGE